CDRHLLIQKEINSFYRTQRDFHQCSSVFIGVRFPDDHCCDRHLLIQKEINSFYRTQMDTDGHRWIIR
ncbi:hypothetical protein, partial [Fischerella thermalis]|uniref:hypothetical protein n=1 Tax=Fischerella thermalis TaxID=372787 RepID=UPI00241F76C0